MPAWEAAIARALLQLAPLLHPRQMGVLDTRAQIGSQNFAPERQQESCSLFGLWPRMFKG